LRNLKHVLAADEQIETLNPAYLTDDVFMEVLGVDYETACRLSDFFCHGNEFDGLDEIEGITPEILERIRKHFIFQEP